MDLGDELLRDFMAGFTRLRALCDEHKGKEAGKESAESDDGIKELFDDDEQEDAPKCSCNRPKTTIGIFHHQW